MKKDHLLLDSEIRELKVIYKRKKVVSGDAQLVEKIYKRMNPNYSLVCDTCIDALAAEVRGLIAYAEKQIRKPIYKFEDESPAVEPKDVVIPEKEGVEVDPNKKEEPAAPAPADEKKLIELNHEGIAGLDNPTLIAYVKQETGVELSEHADRAELLATADDLLDQKEKDDKEDEEAAKIVLPKNGVTGLKSVLIYEYVKQETGVELAEGLKRQELIKAAGEALKAHSDK